MIPRHLLFTAVILLLLAVGMGFYLQSLRSRAVIVEPSTTTLPISAPISGPLEPVTIYVAYDEDNRLVPQKLQIPLPPGKQQRAETVLRALLAVYLQKSSPHPLGRGSDLRAVYLIDSPTATPESSLAVIDLNAPFADGHRSGILVESLTVASLVETLSANVAGIHRVKILMDGKERDTLAGHADLSNLIDVAAVHKMAKQLETIQ
jgi:hypothetical protein